MSVNYRRTWHACYWGAAIQAVAINVVPLFFSTLQTQFAISFEKIGRLVLVDFLVQLAVDFLSLYFVDRLGYRRCFLLTHIITAAGLVLFGVLPRVMPDAYVGMVLATAVYAVGAGLLEVIVSPMADALPSEKKAASLTLVHSFYPLGQVLSVLLTTLVLWIIGREYWWLVVMLWALVPLSNFVRGLATPFPETLPAESRESAAHLLRSGVVWCALFMMMCAGAAEQAMSQWASLFAEQGLGVPKVVGDLLGPCLFAVFMFAGRFAYGRSGERVAMRPLLLISSVACVLCYGLAVFSPFPFLALLGCAFCGLSVSLMWPGTLSYVASQVPNGGTALFACMALAGDAGCSLGPWLTGLVSDVAQRGYTGADATQYGLRAGLLTAAIFPLGMLVFTWFFSRQRKKV